MNVRNFLYIISLTVTIHCIAGSALFAQQKITIVYTNSLNGYLDYCHCKEEPKGGLVKRATEINNIRKDHGTVFLFETGDFFTYDKDEILAKYIVKAYQRIGYDAIQFGDQEFGMGIRDFLEYKNALPFVCGNIKLDDDSGFKAHYKRYRIITRNGFKLGVIGTIASDSFNFSPKDIVSNIKIANQVTEIEKDIKELKKSRVNAIVLLSHSGDDRDRELIRKLKDVHVIIGGHTQALLEQPESYGGRLIVQAGSNGARIGILDLQFDKGKIVKFENSFRRPDDKQPADDPVIRKLIDEYQAEVKEKYKGLKFN